MSTRRIRLVSRLTARIQRDRRAMLFRRALIGCLCASLIVADKRVANEIKQASVGAFMLMAGAGGVVSPPPAEPGVGGDYSYLEGISDLPTGTSFNHATGLYDGETVDTSYNAPVTEIEVEETGDRDDNRANLMAAIASAAAFSGGTRIIVPLGDWGTGPVANDDAYELPARTTPTGWVYIESETVKAGTFIERGVRATPANAALMPKMYQGAINSPVFKVANGASKYRLRGLDFTFAPSGVSWHSDSAGQNQAYGFLNNSYEGETLANYPSYIIVEQCLLRGMSEKSCKRGWWINGSYLAVIDNWFDEIHQAEVVGLDGQCVLITSGPGRIEWRNNYMPDGTGGEPFMVGGSAGKIVPHDIHISRNHVDHPVAWHGVYVNKNLGELKLGVRVLIHSNVGTNYRGRNTGGQTSMWVFKSVNQAISEGVGGTPGAETSHLTVANNKAINCLASFMTFAAAPEIGIGNIYPVVPMHHVSAVNNAWQAATTGDSSAVRQWGWRFDIGTVEGVNKMSYVFAAHNTMWHDKDEYSQILLFNDAGDSPTFTAAENFEFSSNLLVTPHNPTAKPVYGVGANAEIITACGIGWEGNALTDSTPSMPAGTTQVDYDDALLDATTFELDDASPLKGAGVDGRDPGPIHALVDAATAGVVLA